MNEPAVSHSYTELKSGTTYSIKLLRYFFLLTDWGIIAYWLITALNVLPDEYLFKDYHNPILMSWNWSFLPLDLAVSATGLYSLYLQRKSDARWQFLALISLVLTSVSGLQAVVFWTLRSDYDPSWWIPNLYLLLYPLFFIPKLCVAR